VKTRRREGYQVRYQQNRPIKSEAGQAIIEFALTISMTLLLIFGMIEFSRAIYTSSVIQSAAQHGARTGIINASQSVIEAAVKGRMVGLDTSQPLTITFSSTAGIVQVDVTYNFEFVAPMVTLITGDSIPMHASASMVK
jgi:Flp pilus assembly protein TadG